MLRPKYRTPQQLRVTVRSETRCRPLLILVRLSSRSYGELQGVTPLASTRYSHPVKRLLVLLLAFSVAFATAQNVTLLYFNDLHEIAPVSNGVRGGVARLGTIVQQVRAENPATVVIFGGDLVGGTLFGEFQGAPLVEALNIIGIDYANFGQHEFDFGAEVTRQRVTESDFQWTTANLVEADGGAPFAGLPTNVVHEVGGLKLGIFGTTTAMDSTNAFGEVDEMPVIEAAEREVAALQAQGVDVIIAITQQSMAADAALLAAVPAIDIIFSEEQSETFTFYQAIGRSTIAKSAGNITSVVRVDIDLSRTPALSFSTIAVDADVAEDAELAALAEHYTALLDERLGEVVATSSVDLDASATLNRSGETLLGNLIADAMRHSFGSDLAIMNGGGIRSDKVYPAGELTLKNLTEILPFGNTVVLVEVTGEQLLAALENGVNVEAGSGRYPHPSGFTYTYDSSKPVGERIEAVQVVGAGPLDMNATYSLAIGSFVAAGGDGYSSLAAGKMLVDATDGKRDVLALTEYIRQLGTVAPELEGRIVNLAQ